MKCPNIKKNKDKVGNKRGKTYLLNKLLNSLVLVDELRIFWTKFFLSVNLNVDTSFGRLSTEM